MEINKLIEKCAACAITIDEQQAKKIIEFISLMLQTNTTHNLTAITSEDDLLNKHIIDSLMILNTDAVSHCETLFDIGSGAGFPGVLLSIILRDCKVSLIESNQKKANFLKHAKDSLSITNLSIINQRAELTFSRKNIFAADLITARAVSGISQTLELCCNGIKQNGLFAYYASSKQAAEFTANSDIKPLGFKLHKLYEYDLPDNAGRHALVIVQKLWKTHPGYPRSFSKIKAKPL